MSKPLPPQSLIIGDSYFGSISTLEALALEGKYGLFSCQSRRPSFLFGNSIASKLTKNGDTSTLYGTIPNASPEVMNFIANGFQSEGRKLFTISTCFSDQLETVDIDTFIDDEADNDHQIPVHTSETRPHVRNEYSSNMNYNDVGNAVAMTGFPKIRKRDWSSSVLIWLISMLLNVNGQKVFESAKGKKISNPEWRQLVRDTLASYNMSCEIGKASVGNCRSCHFFHGKSRQTVWKCSQCQSICKYCREDGSHVRFASLLRSGAITVKHTYEKGQHLSKLIQRDRKGKILNIRYKRERERRINFLLSIIFSQNSLVLLMINYFSNTKSCDIGCFFFGFEKIILNSFLQTLLLNLCGYLYFEVFMIN